MSTEQILAPLVLAPLVFLWVLRELGFEALVVRVLCWLAKVVTLGMWRPKGDEIDGTAAIAVTGVGLSVLTVVAVGWLR